MLTGWQQTNLEILRGETGVRLKVSKGTVATNVGGFNSERTTMKKLMLGCLSATVGVVSAVQISVTADQVIAEVPLTLYGTGMEDVNHEIYGGLDAQRLYDESFEETEPAQLIAIDRAVNGSSGKVCGRQWTPILGGGGYEAQDEKVKHLGRRSQMLMPNGGIASVWNAGLNGWGVPCREGRKLLGHVWVKGRVTRLDVSLQRADGRRTYATAELKYDAEKDWARADFALVPRITDPQARFVISATGEGKIWIDDAYLADEPTNVFGKIGCREDIVDAFRREGLTFLRWGGSMSNSENLLFRNQKGDRAPYDGCWFKTSSTGFLYKEFAEMANAMKLPFAFSIFAYETTEEAEKIAAWTKKFDGDVYVEIGNEECSGFTPACGKKDLASIRRYCESVRRLVPAMRKVNPRLKFVNAVMWFGDQMPLMEEAFTLTDGICEYWDIHVSNDKANAVGAVYEPVHQFRELLRRKNPQSTMKAAVFEENGGSHGLKRALGHASGLMALRQFGDFVLTSCPANALQPYGHNDNGWDQGQIFFTTDKVWLQPYGWAQQMASANHRDLLVKSGSSDKDVLLSATRDRANTSLVVHFVNPTTEAKPIEISFADRPGLKPVKATVLTSASLDDHNPPDDPDRVSPKDVTAAFQAQSTLPPLSYLIVEYRAE